LKPFAIGLSTPTSMRRRMRRRTAPVQRAGARRNFRPLN
jgi:hypothetical protein